MTRLRPRKPSLKGPGRQATLFSLLTKASNSWTPSAVAQSYRVLEGTARHPRVLCARRRTAPRTLSEQPTSSAAFRPEAARAPFGTASLQPRQGRTAGQGAEGRVSEVPSADTPGREGDRALPREGLLKCQAKAHGGDREGQTLMEKLEDSPGGHCLTFYTWPGNTDLPSGRLRRQEMLPIRVLKREK